MKKDLFYYEKYGNKEKVLIILPGWGDTRKTFNYYINNLKDKFTIYIFDYPGFGNCSFPNHSLTLDDYVLFIKNFICEHNINNPYILCHSFGCRIALLLIGNYRVLVDKLIIIGGAGIRRKSLKRIIKTYKYKLLKSLKIFIKKKNRSNYLNRLFLKYSSEDYKSLNNYQKTTFSNIINTDLRKYLKYISCPTLLIWGESDTSTPLKDGKLMNKKIYNSGLITIKKGTHFVYLEYPLYVLKIINYFLMCNTTKND